MSVSASGAGGLLVRVDPNDTEVCIARPYASRMVMRGRAMDGWIRVEPEGVKTKRELAWWVKRGVGYAKSLPPK